MQLSSTNKRSFVPDVLDKIRASVLDDMTGVLINRRRDQRTEWSCDTDLWRLASAMSVSCLSGLGQWAGLRNFDQFNSFAWCSILTANTPASCAGSPGVCPAGAPPDLDLRVLNSLALDRPKCPPNFQERAPDGFVCSATTAEPGGEARTRDSSGQPRGH